MTGAATLNALQYTVGVAHNDLQWSSKQHASWTASLVAVHAVWLIHTLQKTKSQLQTSALTHLN